MPLPAPWVEKVFLKLSVTYGQSFLRQYDGVDLEHVKANWAHELACFQQSPESIRHGLASLPERAPNVVQFRELCRIPQNTVLLTSALPPVDPEMAAMVKEAFSKASQRIGNREWAHALQAREEGGERLSLAQRSAWREALR